MTPFDVFNQAYQGSRVLITGDTGFKGAWMSIWLHVLGAEVYGYALPPPSDDDIFVRCGLSNHITHIDGDVRNLSALRSFFQTAQPDYAFHLAAQPLVLESYRDPLYTISTNVLGTANFLECVREQKSLRASVIVTTDKCYSNDGSGRPFVESDRLGGKDPYSASKACAELITYSYQHSFGMQGRIPMATARAGNVIGGGDWCEHRLIPDIFRALRRGESVLVRNPKSTRPWQFVLEPIAGYLLLASQLGRGACISDAWNFSPTPENNVTVQDLVERVLHAVGRGDYRIDCDTSNKEASTLSLNSARAQDELGWHPILSIDETIRFTVDGYNPQSASPLESNIQQIADYLTLLRQRFPHWGKPRTYA